MKYFEDEERLLIFGPRYSGLWGLLYVVPRGPYAKFAERNYGLTKRLMLIVKDDERAQEAVRLFSLHRNANAKHYEKVTKLPGHLGKLIKNLTPINR